MAILPRSLLGRNIQKFRLWWDWTQAELAHRADLPPSLVGRIEQDRADPRLSQLRKLAQALRVPGPMLLDSLRELIWVSEDEKERFEGKYRKGRPDECWHWGRHKDSKGYGKARLGDIVTYTHRIAYAITAPLPVNWTVNHNCRDTSCINPKHLEAATGGWNIYERTSHTELKKLKAFLAAGREGSGSK